MKNWAYRSTMVAALGTSLGMGCNGSSSTTGAGGTSSTGTTTATATGATTTGSNATTGTGTGIATATGTGTTTGASTGSGGTCMAMNPACKNCLDQTCATSKNACKADTTCAAGDATLGPCVCNAQSMTSNQKAAQDMCLSQFSAMGNLQMAYASCIQTMCNTECLVN